MTDTLFMAEGRQMVMGERSENRRLLSRYIDVTVARLRDTGGIVTAYCQEQGFLLGFLHFSFSDSMACIRTYIAIAIP